jgi:hypothetical protein
MAEVGYNSKFEGQEVDSRLENVVQAAPGTGSESGKGGLIPAPLPEVKTVARLFLVI